MMETDTATTADAPSTIVPTQQTFDQFFTFDGSDVEIKAIFQGLKVTGRVASQAMVLASPVWKKFIFPPWTVHTGADHQIKTIDFTEDDGCALLILLRLAHLQTTIIPLKLGLDTLFQVAIQCEKYDCLLLLHLILSTWIAAEQNEAVKDESGKWLYICWAFGLEKPFEEAALRMANSGGGFTRRTAHFWRYSALGANA
ncbi:hypothetical protein BKA61DRAFT_247940 [Leptodontidium sp. MPI-SDFR-AT-0119]|nr:hypothetical protein BKA61DRAFT_247940 [Leptodontidium sp. MPI-SDFR-AT-0119]